MSRTLTVCLTLILSVLSVAGTAIAAPRGGQQPRTAAFTANGSFCADDQEMAFLGLINQYRAANGLRAVVITQQLSDASEHHSKSMADNNYFSHTLNPEGIGWSQNMANHGYTYNAWKGENIYAGQEGAQAAFTAWKNSPGHNANMLKAEYQAIGIGRAYNANSTYKWYWTTDFGSYVDASAKVCGGGGVTPVPTATTAPVQPTATSVPGTGTGTAFRIVASGRTSNSATSLYAYDRNTATTWATTSATAPGYGYVYFDLGATQSVGAIKWMFSQVGGADALKIQVSTNKSTWTTLTTKGNAPAANSWETHTQRVSARYVRFYFTNPNKDLKIGFLNEVQITS